MPLTLPTLPLRSANLPPPCRSLGSQCRGIPVILRVGALEEGTPPWIMRPPGSSGIPSTSPSMTSGRTRGSYTWTQCSTFLAATCKPTETAPAAPPTGSRGPTPRGPAKPEQPRRWAGTVRGGGEPADDGPAPSRRQPAAFRSWPANPCALAACRTADNPRGAACCRDLQIEIMCTKRQRRLEALVRSRRSPYLCKVERAGDFSIEAEIISACGYLDDDGIGCTLHGRRRADGRPAKPDLCSEWPQKKHRGCTRAAFSPRRGMRPAGGALCKFPEGGPSSWTTRPGSPASGGSGGAE